MKKISLFCKAFLSAALFALVFTGCPKPAGANTDPDTPENPGNPTNPDNPGNTDSTTTIDAATLTALQKKITDAKAGSTVTLQAGKVAAGSSISISKAITVDGKDIDGLTVTVPATIKDNVVLKNFKNATLKIEKDKSRAVSTHDTVSDDGEKIEKFGDDALPLRLEGCEIKEFIAEDEVALYLGTGDEKTVIEEMNLREGAEKFTFIENDDGIKAEDRSSIGKLFIEDGLKEINLIGGSFDNVDFADDFADKKLDFNYDAEFDQFKDDSFMEKSFVEERDIAIAEYEATNGKGVYKFEMTKADFNKLNGFMGVIFLNDDQAKAATGNCDLEAFQKKATYETPM